LQEGWQKGRQDGEIEVKIKTIDSLLAAGVEWELITKATGITPQQFQALKEQLQLLSSPD
jgi:predicted transposase/invertase (TIGR01784 family)